MHARKKQSLEPQNTRATSLLTDTDARDYVRTGVARFYSVPDDGHKADAPTRNRLEPTMPEHRLLLDETALAFDDEMTGRCYDAPFYLRDTEDASL